GRDAERARQARGRAYGRAHSLGDGPRAREVADDAAEVEVALVDAGALHARHHLLDRAPDGARVLPVESVARSNEDGVRAAAQSLRGAHRRANPEAAPDVGPRRHDAA